MLRRRKYIDALYFLLFPIFNLFEEFYCFSYIKVSWYWSLVVLVAIRLLLLLLLQVFGVVLGGGRGADDEPKNSSSSCNGCSSRRTANCGWFGVEDRKWKEMGLAHSTRQPHRHRFGVGGVALLRYSPSSSVSPSFSRFSYLFKLRTDRPPDQPTNNSLSSLSALSSLSPLACTEFAATLMWQSD